MTNPDFDAMDREQLLAEAKRMHALLWTPETADFMKGVPLEIAHQRDRWGDAHDAKKDPFDWYWALGYLGKKAADCCLVGDFIKAKHHCITVAALAGNWHRWVLSKEAENGSEI